jgi:hypothetical protein
MKNGGGSEGWVENLKAGKFSTLSCKWVLPTYSSMQVKPILSGGWGLPTYSSMQVKPILSGGWGLPTYSSMQVKSTLSCK